MKKWVISLFVMCEDEQLRQLCLGQVGGESLLFRLCNSQWVYYEIKPDEQDVIVP